MGVRKFNRISKYLLLSLPVVVLVSLTILLGLIVYASFQWLSAESHISVAVFSGLAEIVALGLPGLIFVIWLEDKLVENVPPAEY